MRDDERRYANVFASRVCIYDSVVEKEAESREQRERE